MTRKAWIIFSVLCLGVIGGLIYISNNSKLDVSKIDVNKKQETTNDNGNIPEHIYGNADSKVILIEYADYQCPGCGSAAPEIKKVAEKYKDKIAYIFRNYPIYAYHPNAFAAAATAEAAGLQGKFWEMHSYIYEHQSEWNNLTGDERTNFFANAARELGLDSERLVKDLDSESIKKKINYDLALGKEAGVEATPSLFLNGKEVGNQDVKDDKLVPTDNDSSTPIVWSDADLIERYIIIPALKEAGIE